MVEVEWSRPDQFVQIVACATLSSHCHFGMFFLVSAGQSLNPGICRLSDHDLRIFEVIWVDVKSPLTISKCPRRIPNSNWIEFPSLHFLTCACFYRRSLHHLKRCRTPNRRGTNKKESDLLSVQILEASWPNESWQVASTASRSATEATNSTWNSRGGLISCEMGRSWTAAYSTSLRIIALWFLILAILHESIFSGQKQRWNLSLVQRAS